MKGSKELIEHYNRREEELGEKATKFNMYLEGYAEGYRDTKAYMIEKACDWLRGYIGLDASLRYLSTTHLLEDFREAMEE